MEEGGEPEIIRIIYTHAGVSDDRETIIGGEGKDPEVFDCNTPHLRQGFTLEIVDVEEDDARGERNRVEHERTEAEKSSTLPALMEMLPENNGGEQEVDDCR